MAASATMSKTVPRGALIGAAALVAFTILAALAGRVTGAGAVRLDRGTELVGRDLRFEDGPGGEVIIRTAADGRVVDVLAPQTNAFVRSTMRGLVRVRKHEHLGADAPFRLSRLADGRLRLQDAATRRQIDLKAFGPSNVGAFSAIMDAATRVE